LIDCGVTLPIKRNTLHVDISDAKFWYFFGLKSSDLVHSNRKGVRRICQRKKSMSLVWFRGYYNRGDWKLYFATSLTGSSVAVLNHNPPLMANIVMIE
jgi:hypothetical protein